MQHTPSYHFVLIEDSKIDTFIAKVKIEALGPVCLSFTSFLDAQEALEYLQKRKILPERTIIFLDIQMPLMTGFEFIEAYDASLSEEQKANYVINILSSSINEKDILLSKRYKSVVHFLNKPLREDMIQTVLDDLSNNTL